MAEAASVRRRRTTAYVASTFAASAAGAAAVGWAAATPVAPSSPALQQANTHPTSSRAVAHQLRVARAALERVRRDVASLARQAANLPNPHLTGTGPAASPGSTSVYVPPAAPVPAAPPPANTTTGASGVRP